MKSLPKVAKPAQSRVSLSPTSLTSSGRLILGADGCTKFLELLPVRGRGAAWGFVLLWP